MPVWWSLSGTNVTVRTGDFEREGVSGNGASDARGKTLLMEVFFDTRVIVPLLIEEPGSAKAVEVWKSTGVAWAWEWALVETEAALVRRRSPSEAWAQWRGLSRRILFLRLGGKLSEVS